MHRILDFRSFTMNEAQTFNPDELRSIVKKDPTISMLLDKGTKFSDIKDAIKFYATVKNIFLNNPNIIKYNKDTYEFNDWGPNFERLRKIKPADFNENDFTDLIKVFAEVLKQTTRQGKNMVSTEVKKAIENWINTSGIHNRRIQRYMVEEIDSIPGLKPEKPIKLYRGLMWDEYSMAEGKEGHKFIQSIRQNENVADYEIKTMESWTLDKSVAKKFAVAGPAQSEFSAMMNWLKKGNDYIEGELGAIVMVLAKPEDVLADLSKVGNKLVTNYEWEDEVILKPGKYVVKIVTLFDKSGAITPQEFVERTKERSKAA